MGPGYLDSHGHALWYNSSAIPPVIVYYAQFVKSGPCLWKIEGTRFPKMNLTDRKGIGFTNLRPEDALFILDWSTETEHFFSRVRDLLRAEKDHRVNEASLRESLAETDRALNVLGLECYNLLVALGKPIGGRKDDNAPKKSPYAQLARERIETVFKQLDSKVVGGRDWYGAFKRLSEK